MPHEAQPSMENIKIVRFHKGSPWWKIEMLWNAYIYTTNTDGLNLHLAGVQYVTVISYYENVA